MATKIAQFYHRMRKKAKVENKTLALELAKGVFVEAKNTLINWAPSVTDLLK